MYTYGWFMLMFDRNQHSSVKPLSFNYIKLKKKKMSHGDHMQCIIPGLLLKQKKILQDVIGEI